MRDAAVGPADAADGRDAVSGMLNSIGLQGPGIDAFLDTDLPWLLRARRPAVVSIAGGDVEEYAELARRVCAARRASPRSRSTSPARTSRTAGWSSPATPSRRRRVIAAVRRDTARGVPVFAKLSPDVTDIVDDRRVGASTPAPTGCR